MISVASSIKFREVISGALPSFDNTFHEDESFQGARLLPYCQKFLTSQTVTIQAKVLTGQTVEMSYSEGDGGSWQSMTGETLMISGPVYDYYEIEIDFSTFSSTNVRFLMVTLEEESIEESWMSEMIELVEEDSQLMKADFFNLENAFEVDYSTGIAHTIYVEADMREYKPGGESSVFDNQNEITKIKAEVKRILTFKTEPIPRYLAEMLFTACQHDKLWINDVEFVAEGTPEFDLNGIFSVNLTQRNVIGLNTHDIGYNCDSILNTETMVLQEENASGQVSFTVPEGYMIATITGYRTAGSPVVTAGKTAGGTDIMASLALSSGTPLKVKTLNTEISFAGDNTLYCEVTGSGATANIYVLLIKNRQ